MLKHLVVQQVKLLQTFTELKGTNQYFSINISYRFLQKKMAWFHLLIHSLYHEIFLKDTLKYPLQRRDILLQFMFKQFHELQTVLQSLVTSLDVICL